MKCSFHYRRLAAACLAVLLTLVGADRARADSVVYHKTLRATGWVVSPAPDGGFKSGTGVLIDREQRLFLTNYHVAGGATNLKVYFPGYHPDGNVITDPAFYLQRVAACPARVVAGDPKLDLALLQLEWLPVHVRAAPRAPAGAKPGDIVYSIGQSGLGNGANKLLWGYRKGQVLQIAREVVTFGNTGLRVDARFLRTRHLNNSGDSGGPVVDAHGRLVAIVVGGDLNKGHGLCIDRSEIEVFLAGHGRPAPDTLELAPRDARPSGGLKLVR